MSDGWLKRGEFAEFESEMDVLLLSPRSHSSAWFYVEIRPFLSEMPEMCSAVSFSVQIKRIREQQKRQAEKAAREAKKVKLNLQYAEAKNG